MSTLLKTPLHATHEALGARMVPFAGFSMPVQYGSIKKEHAAVRENVGLFDVSHMGQIHFQGPDAVAAVEWLVSCPVASLRPGRVRYGVLCNEEGGVVDDVTVYRVDATSLFLCVNASNIEKDYRWCVKHTRNGTEVRNRSTETALLALQGPRSSELLAGLTDVDVEAMRRFRFIDGEVAGRPATLSHTGYTGSDGWEIYLPAEHAVETWSALCERGAEPCGLGARDTLRLEAALPLYGHELDDTTSPLEAGLDRFVKQEDGDFLGADAVRRRAAEGHPRQLIGFEMVERGIARAEHLILSEGQEVGVVTSGAPSPTLGKSIGLGYVPPALAKPGTRIDVQIRDKTIEAVVVETPFA